MQWQRKYTVQRSVETTYSALLRVREMGSRYAAAVGINTSAVPWHSRRNKEKQ